LTMWRLFHAGGAVFPKSLNLRAPSGAPANLSFLRNRVRQPVCAFLLAGTVMFATSPAHSITLTDTYFGGLDTYNNPGDVIGTQTFDITSVDVTRSGPGNGTLNITIHSYFAGAPGTGPADGTGYGSLFFSTNLFTPNGTAPSYPQDQYTQNRWNYAFTMPTNPNPSGSNISPNSTGAGLYAIGNVTGSTSVGSVVQSYKTGNGTITMSNVNGNPITAPASGNPGFYFREGQAVQYTPDSVNGVVNGTSGTWSVIATTPSTEGAVIFSILDNGALGNNFMLEWAMTCANDVFLGSVNLPPGEQFSTPLPAAFPLFASGLGALGFLGWRRKQRTAALR
jgi:hypothetical protein